MSSEYQQSDGSALFDPEKNDRFRQQVKARKEKTKANLNLSNFNLITERSGNSTNIQTNNEKIQLLPRGLENDPDEALLYLYFCARNMDESMFKVILTRTRNMENAPLDVRQLFRDSRSYSKLVVKTSFARQNLNQFAFEISLEKDYMDVAAILIEKEKVSVTWEMIRKMLSSRQEYLVKQCIKFDVRFDSSAA